MTIGSHMNRDMDLGVNGDAFIGAGQVTAVASGDVLTNGLQGGGGEVVIKNIKQ